MSDAPRKPEWHEEDHPSQSVVHEGIDNPMAFSDRPRAARKAVSVAELVEGVLAGNRTALGQAITLMESSRADHRAKADELLEALYPHSQRSKRIGITGVPGVGKSTFIEAFGTSLCSEGHKLAVLTIDPSSEITGGSILGDKTRMEQLSRQDNAFIRPSPSRGVLGGVARWTREAMVILEAAGYDTIFIETVGVGQSETLIRGMVDCFVLLTLAGAGDELQGIKKGIMEIADLIAITKADGTNLPKANAARAQLERVVEYLPRLIEGWKPTVMAISSLEKLGLDKLWDGISQFFKTVESSGALAARREAQRENWLMGLLSDGMAQSLRDHPDKAKWLEASHSTLPTVLAGEILAGIFGADGRFGPRS